MGGWWPRAWNLILAAHDCDCHGYSGKAHASLNVQQASQAFTGLHVNMYVHTQDAGHTHEAQPWHMSTSQAIPLPTSRPLLCCKLRLELPPFLGALPNPHSSRRAQSPAAASGKSPSMLHCLHSAPRPTPRVCPVTRGRTWSSGRSGPQAQCLPSLGTGVSCAKDVLPLLTEEETEAQSSQAARKVQSVDGKHGPTLRSLPPPIPFLRRRTEDEAEAPAAAAMGLAASGRRRSWRRPEAQAAPPAAPGGPLPPCPGRAYPRWAFAAVSRQDPPPWCSHG